MSDSPIVMISSYPPRLCGIATFVEEAREFVARGNPHREVLVISHTDGEGDGVFPLIDPSRRDWWKPVTEKVRELGPYAVHIQHEYGLYEHVDERGLGDRNAGFLELLDAIAEYPIIVEPHTVHGRLTDHEADFVYQLCKRADILVLKCDYQKWRLLEWTFPTRGWTVPNNVMVIPHGARPDRRWSVKDVPRLRRDLGLDKVPGLSKHLVGLIGWIQSNKRWDILTSMWEEIEADVRHRTGVDWDLFAAGTMRDPNHRADYERWKGELKILEKKKLAHYYEFVPRGENYYKAMAVCDFIVLPSIDETQSGTLARIIALNKPFITTAPMEGLTSQTIESEGGLLFTNREGLRRHVTRLACDENLRMSLGDNLKRYLDHVVSWEVVAGQYCEAYALARLAKTKGRRVSLPTVF